MAAHSHSIRGLGRGGVKLLRWKREEIYEQSMGGKELLMFLSRRNRENFVDEQINESFQDNPQRPLHTLNELKNLIMNERKSIWA